MSTQIEKPHGRNHNSQHPGRTHLHPMIHRQYSGNHHAEDKSRLRPGVLRPEPPLRRLYCRAPLFIPPDDLLEHARAGHDAGIPAGLLLFHQENIGKAGCIKDVPYRFTDIGNDHRIFPEFMVCHQEDTQTG